MKFENVTVFGFEYAIRGLVRTTVKHESDSYFNGLDDVNIGPEDLNILKRFGVRPVPNRDPLKIIRLYADITAPLYFWEYLGLYGADWLGDSVTSSLHWHEDELTIDDFARMLHVGENALYDPQVRQSEELKIVANIVNENLRMYRKGHVTDSAFFTSWCDLEQALRALPTSYSITRTVDISYRDLKRIYDNQWLESFKSSELFEFCDFIEGLPCSDIIIFERKEKERENKEEMRKRMMEKEKANAEN